MTHPYFINSNLYNTATDRPGKTFAAVAGFAYQSLPGAGGGASADSEDLLGADRADSTQVGFSQHTNMNPPVDNGQTFRATLANPYPDGFIAAQRS